MTHVTEKDGSEVAALGIRTADESRMDYIELRYQKYNGGEETHLSVVMSDADDNCGAVPLVDLIKYAMQYHPELLDAAASALVEPLD